MKQKNFLIGTMVQSKYRNRYYPKGAIGFVRTSKAQGDKTNSVWFPDQEDWWYTPTSYFRRA